MKTDKMKEHYDSRSAGDASELEEGDAAWLHNPQRKKGISPLWRIQDFLKGVSVIRLRAKRAQNFGSHTHF